MPVAVLKFGGSSLSDIKAINDAAVRIINARELYSHIVVVVSAMGKTTDSLTKLANEITKIPSKREMDMLLSTGEQVSAALMSMTINAKGVQAISLNAAQANLITDDHHTQAKFLSFNTDKLLKHLEDWKIVIITGFQGITDNGNFTTLGRGGSDTTAVVIAAALNAVCCEIYTDVDGVYTADPRIVNNARKLEYISYNEMLEMAVLGAKVMHPRAVQVAAHYHVPIHVRHSKKTDPGTMIDKEKLNMEKESVIGCALKENLARITLYDIPNTKGIASKIFKNIADASIMVDDIVQTIDPHAKPDIISDIINDPINNATISFTMDNADISSVQEVLEKVLKEIGSGKIQIDDNLSKISAIGLGMQCHSGVAAKMFQALNQASINIENVTTSEIKISCIIKSDKGHKALQSIHDTFGLGNISNTTLPFEVNNNLAKTNCL